MGRSKLKGFEVLLSGFANASSAGSMIQYGWTAGRVLSGQGAEVKVSGDRSWL
jgi:hypothetical protein